MGRCRLCKTVGEPEIEVERHTAFTEQTYRRFADRDWTLLVIDLKKTLAELDRTPPVA